MGRKHPLPLTPPSNFPKHSAHCALGATGTLPAKGYDRFEAPDFGGLFFCRKQVEKDCILPFYISDRCRGCGTFPHVPLTSPSQRRFHTPPTARADGGAVSGGDRSCRCEANIPRRGECAACGPLRQVLPLEDFCICISCHFGNIACRDQHFNPGQFHLSWIHTTQQGGENMGNKQDR